ncbi:sugar kinase [Vibrio metoecus]|uniref:sugar kinase n=1 Tax=Vibrio metoecus TaxID=1481663 RepID=UPI0006D8480C|nr:sugar kinase [Vibrio metoecus]KQA97434.1 sugar kinase [Vibrio metoecus]KQB04907.1 sugar kinase [Vibrio metoecus]PAR29477.1 sugar kinase [Vibrio metoecus]PAR49955.1 sugar kinase [Vibrio metoecus]PAR54977.1 sugar kinase [Vibrio metoecus]
MKKKIAVLGECMLEIQKTQSGLRQGFGGDTLNTAVYLARLARAANVDLSVSYFTALGKDHLSDDMINSWQQEGVDTTYVARYADKLPGLYLIENREDGERDFHYWRQDAAARYWIAREDNDHLYSILSDYDLIYLSGITLAIQDSTSLTKLLNLIKKLKESGCVVAFDTNYRERLWPTPAQAQECYEQMLALTHMALLTLDDEQKLYQEKTQNDTLTRLQAFGLAQLVLKSGSDGCMVVTQGKEQWVPTTVIHDVVDTTAAGDSFNAAYLYQWLSSYDAIQAALAGHRLAGQVIRHYGAIIAQEAMPTL